MSKRKEKRLEAARAAGRAPSGRTRVLGVLAGAAVLAVFSAELTRVWRLGMLPHPPSGHGLLIGEPTLTVSGTPTQPP
jgi:hypothetical protein